MQPAQLRKLVRRWAIPIVLVTILGAAASFVVSHRLTPIYEATGSVLVIAGPASSAGSGTISINPAQATTTAATIMTEPSLLAEVISTLHLKGSTDSLAKSVSASPVTSTELVNVTAKDPSPARAAAIANGLMTAYYNQVKAENAARISQSGLAIQKQINNVQATLATEDNLLAAELKAGQDTTAVRQEIQLNTTELTQLNLSYATFAAAQSQQLDAVSIAQRAAVPTAPASPNVPINTIAGALVALILAAGIAYAVEFLDQGLKSAEDVRERLGLPCLGVIPKFRHIPSNDRPTAPNHRHDEAVRESYRRLRINLLFATPDTDLKSVVITSVRAGEGKTCTAANLAIALAGSERHVLLIDADLRKPDQHRLFETTLQGGLSELILKTPTVARVQLNGFRPTRFANLSLLTAGTTPPNPAELLASKRAVALLHSIGPQEDLIMIDTAPAGLVTDAFGVAAVASATILIVEAGKTNASEAAGVIDALRDVGANVIGVVLNKASRRTGAGYYKYGDKAYGYGNVSDGDAASADDLVEPETERDLAPDRDIASASTSGH